MRNQIEFDVVIAGASCAGLYAAYLLAKAGLCVAVYERQKMLGQPGRTLIVTGELGKVLGLVPDGAVVHQVDIMELISRRRRTRVHLESPDWVVERAAMVQQLGKMAAAVGADLYFDHTVQHLEWQRDRV
jgi:flavin-dependent dehydrogenase